MVDDTTTITELNRQLVRLLRGETPEIVSQGIDLDPALAELVETVNRLLVSFKEAQDFIRSLADGDLEAPAPSRNLLISPFKQLQANLLHLTWQTRQIAAGDFSQRVCFMGDFATAFNSMVEALEEKRRVENSLRIAQEQVRQLEGIIPICMYCKQIRDDSDCWHQLEVYISEHSDAFFSHGICPTCFDERYGDQPEEKTPPS
jgi:methyl-accepting chemotaxis protein